MENDTILALDVGEKRVGVALANVRARLAKPWGALDRLEDIWTALEQLITEKRVKAVVIGLPRGLDGQETAQTAAARNFETELKNRFSLLFYFQDEAVTSKKAEEELHARGVLYNKGDVDALAATYILTDFLLEHPEV